MAGTNTVIWDAKGSLLVTDNAATVKSGAAASRGARIQKQMYPPLENSISRFVCGIL
jgi:hypothetical protein